MLWIYLVGLPLWLFAFWEDFSPVERVMLTLVWPLYLFAFVVATAINMALIFKGDHITPD